MIPYALYNVYANISSKYVMFESSFSQYLDHFVMYKESVKVITMANTPKLLISAEGSRFWALEKPLADLDFLEGNLLIFWIFSLFLSVFTVKDDCFLQVSTAPWRTGIAKVFGNHVCFEFACLKNVEQNMVNRGCP